MLAAKLVRCVDGYPLLGLVQVEHLNFADIRCPTQLVQVAVLHDDQTRCASAVVEARHQGPRVLDYIIHLARFSAVRSMPGANDKDVAIVPLGDSVGIPLVVHVSATVKFPRRLIQHTRLLKIGLGVGDGTSGHVDAPTHLNALLVPHRLKVVVPYQALRLGPVDEVECDDVVLVEQVKTCAPRSHCHLHLASW